MVPNSDEEELERLQLKYVRAHNDLFDHVKAMCGDSHLAHQHRDGHSPWCKLCGRTNRGILIKEV